MPGSLQLVSFCLHLHTNISFLILGYPTEGWGLMPILTLGSLSFQTQKKKYYIPSWSLPCNLASLQNSTYAFCKLLFGLLL